MRSSNTAILLVAALIAPTWLMAQQDSIDEVSVTAKRRLANIEEVSSAVSVSRREDLEKALVIPDALRASTGVFVQQTTTGQGAAIVRGVKGSAVLHLVDGIRLNNAIFRDAPTQYLALVPTVSIDRLEVVRGAPTSLYGSDAVGGVVQAISRMPEFNSDAVESRVNAQLNFDTANLARGISTTVDIGNREFVSSVSAQYEQSGNRRTGGGPRIANTGYTAGSLRVLLAGQTSVDRSWLLDVHALRQPETPRADELVAGFGQSEPSSSEFLFKPNQRLFVHAQRRDRNGFLGQDWAVDLAWQSIVDDRTMREYESANRILEQNRSDLFAATISAAGESDHRTWIAGAELYYDRVRSSRLQQAVATGQETAVAPRFPDGSTVRQVAVYGNVDSRVGNRNLLSGGLRVSSVTVDLPESLGSEPLSLSTSDVSGDLGWVFDVRNNLQLVANAGYGFRAPNVFDLGTLGNRPGNRFNIPNSNLKSERALHGDLGFRWRSDKWQSELLFFALDYKDRITSVNTGDLTPGGREIVQSVNAAESSIHGVEFGFEATINDSIQLTANLTYTKGSQAADGNDVEPADRIPPLNGLLRISHEDFAGWRFSGTLLYAGRQDRLSARDIRDVRINPLGTSGWGSVNLRAERLFRHNLNVALEIGNVLDKNYRMHGSGLDTEGRNLSVAISRVWR